MTQRVARPMKFAAFISIIISVAVMFVACQGAVGPEGPKGETGERGPQGERGEPGQTGETGQTGEQGTGAFELISDEVHTVLFNVQEEAGKRTVEGERTVDVSTFFRGGTDVTYKFSPEKLDDFTLAIAGSTLTITPTKSGTDLPAPADATAADGPFSDTVKSATATDAKTQSVVITATDGDDVERAKTVNVQYNRAPRVGTGALATFPVDAAGFATISIGTQRDVIMNVTSETDPTLKATPRAWGDGPGDSNLVTCKTYNECEILIETFYDDDDDSDATDDTDMQGARTYAAVSSDSAVSVTPIKGGLRLTVNGMQAKQGPVTIDEITATDANGITFKDSRTITVNVDPRPTDRSVQYSLEVPRGSADTTVLIPALGDFFENKDGAGDDQTLTFNLEKDVTSPLVTVAIADAATQATVEVSAVASRGNYQFTVRAREAGYRPATGTPHTSAAVGQWVDKELTLSVTDAASS